MSEEEFFSPYTRSEPISIFFMVWTLALCVIGCVGNTLVIGAVLTYKKLRTLPNVFVFNLAIADFIVTCFISSFGMVGIQTDGYFFEGKKVLCNLIGTVCITACSCSLWSVASISLNRYVIICHRMVYPRLYNKRTVPFIIMGIWIVCFFVDLPNLIGWGRHGFDERIQLCTYDFTYSYSYTFFFIGIGFGVPVCVSIFSYVSILRFSSHSNKVLVRMSVGTTSYNTSVATKKQIHADRRLLKSVLIILVVFIIMWTPHSVMVLGDYYARWPRILHVIGLALAHANSSINSFIYAAYNKDFRRGYIYFMRFIFYRVILCFSKRGAVIKPMPDDFTQTVGDSTQVVTIS